MIRVSVVAGVLVMVSGFNFQMRGDNSETSNHFIPAGYVTKHGPGRKILETDNAATQAGEPANSPFPPSQQSPPPRKAVRPHHRVALSWDPSLPDSSSQQGAISGYNVYRRTPGTTAYIKINSDLVPDTNYLDDSVRSGGVYLYRTTAVNDDGIESAPSNLVVVSIPYP